ncbi:hypothetical protein HNQ56_000271 [Anaerotaenia torta]|uniref:zinc ribbon domain-containing protein n=1 Tax=Anaerotaenia torta TaxID=433293 RepID=UPI003D22BB50
MICNNCGRQIQNEAANFCEYCGFSFREQRQGTEAGAVPEPGQSFLPRQDMQQRPLSMSGMEQFPSGMTQAGLPQGEAQDKPISFLGWLGTYALLLVPYVGWLIFIVMLFVWAFSNSTPATKKNWARVTLIFVGILIIALLVLMIFVYMPYYQQMMSGDFDFNSFYKGLSNNLQ